MLPRSSAYSLSPSAYWDQGPWSHAGHRARGADWLQLHFISTKVLAITAALGMGSEGPGERVRGSPGDLDRALLGEVPGAAGALWAAPPPAGSAGTGPSSSCGASGAGCPGTDEP